MRILVLQGPNLNRLGLRKPKVYGTQTLSGIQEEMEKKAGDLGCTLVHFQSNSEGEIIHWLQERQDEANAIICNPAGITNYGLSLKDALAETEQDLAITPLEHPRSRGVETSQHFHRGVGCLPCGSRVARLPVRSRHSAPTIPREELRYGKARHWGMRQ